jgi:hypothetical protein
LRLTGEGGAPGPLVQGAVSLALLLGRGHVLDLGRMVAVVTDADRCEKAGKLDPACLAGAVFAAPAADDPTDGFRRAAALYHLVQLGAAGDAAAGEPICRVVLESDKLPGELLPVAEYAFRRAQPACGAGGWTAAREALFDPDGRWAQPIASGGPFVESAAASWWPRAHGAGAAGQPGAGLEPQAEPGEPTVTGAVGLEVVKRIVAQRRPQLRRCYDTALRTVPGLQGRVAVKFTIATAGGVEQTTVVENQTGDDRLAECVADVLQGMVFPELDAPTEVVYPFQFGLVPSDASP